MITHFICIINPTAVHVLYYAAGDGYLISCSFHSSQLGIAAIHPTCCAFLHRYVVIEGIPLRGLAAICNALHCTACNHNAVIACVPKGISALHRTYHAAGDGNFVPVFRCGSSGRPLFAAPAVHICKPA